MKTESPTDAPPACEERVSASATLIVAAGLAAAWIAAGSSGHLAEPLRHALTVLALAIGIVTGCSSAARPFKDWVVLGVGSVIGIVLALVPNEVVNVISAVMVLSALANFRGGVDGRAIRVAAQGVLVFAALHLALATCPSLWVVGDGLGRSLGWFAEAVTGQRLSIGATFAGVDFLLLMGALYGLWLKSTASPRRTRAIGAAVAILAAQLSYLVVLAFADKIAAVVTPIYPIEDDYMRMGVSAWQNTMRIAIPWNVPAIGLTLQALVAAAMFRLARWTTPPAAAQQSLGKNSLAKSQAEALPKIGEIGRIGRFGPILVAAILAAFASLWTTKPDLKGKTIVAYRSSDVAWATPRVASDEENGYTLLGDFVKSLGGTFVLSRSLAAEELAQADAVLLLMPDAQFSAEQEARMAEYLARGGSMLVASDANAVSETALKSSGIRIEATRARGRAESWEQANGAIAHPVTMGISDARNGYGLDSVSTLDIHWPACPILVGRWGRIDSSADGQSDGQAGRLGDAVLVAESTARGGGKIIVLGNESCLNDDMLPASYEFAGRLLGYLVQKSPAFPHWRTAGVLLLAVILIAFVVTARTPLQLASMALTFSAALLFSQFCTLEERQITLRGTNGVSRRIALIDASHIEAYSDKVWHPRPTVKEFSGDIMHDPGVGNFGRTLARNGYLPLRMVAWSPALFDRASVFVAIAPARSYTEAEAEQLRTYVESGGTLLCIVGAEESRAINPLLAKFNLRVPHSPVHLRETDREPAPRGSLVIDYKEPTRDMQRTFCSYAAWHVESLTTIPEYEKELVPKELENTIFIRPIGDNNGLVAVIADSYYAANENPDPALNAADAGEAFWQWFLPYVDVTEESRRKNAPENTPARSPKESLPVQEGGPDEGQR